MCTWKPGPRCSNHAVHANQQAMFKKDTAKHRVALADSAVEAHEKELQELRDARDSVAPRTLADDRTPEQEAQINELRARIAAKVDEGRPLYVERRQAQKQRERAFKNYRKHLDEYLLTPEGINNFGLYAHAFNDGDKPGTQILAEAIAERQRLLEEGREMRRWQESLKDMDVDQLRQHLVSEGHNLADAKKAYIDRRIDRLLNPPSNPSNGLKPQNEWSERWTQKSELQGLDSAQIHQRAVDALRENTGASQRLLRAICNTRRTSTTTMRMIARGARNPGIQDKAFTQIAIRGMQRRYVKPENQPTPLGEQVEMVHSRITDESYLERMESAARTVVRQQMYRGDESSRESRVFEAVEKECDSLGPIRA